MPSPDQPHLPQQVPIDAYGDGGFRFAGMRRRGSLLCLPSGLYPWRPCTLGEVTSDDLASILAEQPSPDFVLFGVGPDIAAVPTFIKEALTNAGIGVEPMDTGAAARTYNVLLAEQRAVAAALICVP